MRYAALKALQPEEGRELSDEGKNEINTKTNRLIAFKIPHKIGKKSKPIPSG